MTSRQETQHSPVSHMHLTDFNHPLSHVTIMPCNKLCCKRCELSTTLQVSVEAARGTLRLSTGRHTTISHVERAAELIVQKIKA